MKSNNLRKGDEFILFLSDIERGCVNMKLYTHGAGVRTVTVTIVPVDIDFDCCSKSTK